MLRGRRAEQERIEGLLDAARAGRSGALVVRGEPGIGKTSLLERAASRADGIRVLRGTGVESEAELSFAGLHLLLRPALDRLDALPDVQRRALGGALGLADGAGGSDRFLIGAAVLSLLAEAAEDAPLLCLVDDAHWLDRASADALLFAARRLDHEGVLVVFGARDHPGAFPAPGVPELRLDGLDPASAAALLDDTGVALAPPLRRRLIEESCGNPLALRELPAVAARGAPHAPVPVTDRVLDAFHHQIGSLPERCRRLLLLAAADTSGEPAALLRAARDLDATLDDLGPAEERGLVSLTPEALAFRHPLVRAAVYHGAPAASRIAAHRALAAACTDADLRAWHAAAAAVGPDERVAADLEAAADRAVRRGGHAAAATAYERAGRLSGDSAEADRRLVLACEAAAHGGQLDWARTRAEALAGRVADRGMALRLVQVRAAARFGRGDLHEAHRLLVDGAAASTEPVDAFWMLVRALHAAWAAPTDVGMIGEAVDRLGEVGLAPDDPLTAVGWLARWGTALVLDRDASAFPDLDAVLGRARTAAATMGPRGLTEVISRALVAARDEEAAEIATALIADAHAQGVVLVLPAALGHLALAQVVLGRHREARVTGDECLRMAAATGQPLWTSYAAGALAYLAAVEGDAAACRHFTAIADPDGTADPGTSSGAAWARAAQGLLDLGEGRVQDALDRLRALADGPSRHLSAVVRSVPDLVEAAVRLGRGQDVTEPLALFTRWAALMRRPWIDALLARCRALTAGTDAERHFRDALDLHEPHARPFERARTELLYGEWLRRARRKSTAREHLTAAMRAFEEIGAAPWAARARAELVATGAAATRPQRPGPFPDLTPQEQQITQLAADGLSNRDIAARLCLSPRTVAYHLYKAYPKLGISSRGELASLTR